MKGGYLFCPHSGADRYQIQLPRLSSMAAEPFCNAEKIAAIHGNVLLRCALLGICFGRNAISESRVSWGGGCTSGLVQFLFVSGDVCWIGLNQEMPMGISALGPQNALGLWLQFFKGSWRERGTCFSLSRNSKTREQLGNRQQETQHGVYLWNSLPLDPGVAPFIGAWRDGWRKKSITDATIGGAAPWFLEAGCL